MSLFKSVAFKVPGIVKVTGSHECDPYIYTTGRCSCRAELCLKI